MQQKQPAVTIVDAACEWIFTTLSSKAQFRKFARDSTSTTIRYHKMFCYGSIGYIIWLMSSRSSLRVYWILNWFE